MRLGFLHPFLHIVLGHLRMILHWFHWLKSVHGGAPIIKSGSCSAIMDLASFLSLLLLKSHGDPSALSVGRSIGGFVSVSVGRSVSMSVGRSVGKSVGSM